VPSRFGNLEVSAAICGAFNPKILRKERFKRAGVL